MCFGTGDVANLQTTKSPAGPGLVFWNSYPIHPRNRPCGAKSLILKGINGVADGARTPPCGERRGINVGVLPVSKQFIYPSIPRIHPRIHPRNSIAKKTKKLHLFPTLPASLHDSFNFSQRTSWSVEAGEDQASTFWVSFWAVNVRRPPENERSCL